MLSEIYFLKLEAARRAADSEIRSANVRFVPLAPSAVPEKIASTAFQPRTATPQH